MSILKWPSAIQFFPLQHQAEVEVLFRLGKSFLVRWEAGLRTIVLAMLLIVDFLKGNQRLFPGSGQDDPLHNSYPHKNFDRWRPCFV